jgi:ABC-type transport system involved in multi-copper enzyme maturation permease subunit
MIARIARLTRAEILKLSAHPFLYACLALLAVTVIVAALLQPALRGQKETVWRSYHALQLAAYGFKFGLWIATYVLLIFSGMIFAGEFDRGTLKNLLTRPISRADLFLAKCVTVAGLGVLLFGFTLFTSLAYGFARGDLGPVWDDGQYIVLRPGPEIAGHAVRAVAMSLVPFLAAGFLGLLVSNLTESSGYAVAIAVVVHLFGEFATGMLSETAQQKVFVYYAPYALGKLQTLAEGTTTSWSPDVLGGRLYLLVPAIYVAAFIPLAFGVFRSRNITA